MDELRLDFHTKVLGRKAAKRLRHLNGFFLTFRSEPVNRYIFYDIYLDDKKLGRAWPTIYNEVRLNIDGKTNLGIGILNEVTASLGGFDTVEEQQQALKRAGYRFKPLDKYWAYPIIFWACWSKGK